MRATEMRKTALPVDLRVLGLWLISVLSTACSVDVGKLRAPAVTARDAATEGSVGADLGQVSGVDAEDDVIDVDVLAIPLDLPLADQVVNRDEGSDAPSLIGADGRVADTNPAEALADPPDLPLTSEDGGDSSTGGGDQQVAGDSGDSRDDGPAEATGGGGGGGAGGSGGWHGGTGGRGGAGGAGGISGTGGTVADPDLVLWYRFDESTGTVAADSSTGGAGKLDGTLATTGASGSATFSTDCQVGTHALRLTSSSYGSTQAGGYVTTPAPASLVPGAITVAFWVKVADASAAQNWARVFDFGHGTGATDPYFYLTARASDTSKPRFGITDIGHGVNGVQRLDSPSSLSADVWYHIAVTLPAGSPYTGTLYIDGVAVAANDAMTVHPADIGPTTENWLGRSPYTTDPFFSGWLDDFRIYKRALSAAEVAALAALR